ncbi:hypothetical protein R3Q08_31025 [Rhodococcus erythropolis]|uniref:hypothetical protein n=1 Tax=Rhodococcus erythropolis TaxID=1833 RepID=UPI0029494C89|nr:hypothetical protein [Rhodococcus erythropolis]MDV6212697.1 hypothetical protein [Rhodococcus erythropolis]
MTTQHRLARSGFTLTRDYPIPVDRIWTAFADEDQKVSWWGDGDRVDTREWAFDFHVGGRDVDKGKFPNGIRAGRCRYPIHTRRARNLLRSVLG